MVSVMELPERIAMCANPNGTNEHVPLKPGEDPPTTCFALCDCHPVVFVRADLHAGAVEALREAQGVMLRRMHSDDTLDMPYDEDMGLALQHIATIVGGRQ